MVPSPLLVKVMEPVAPPIPIMSAFAADAHRSSPADSASRLEAFCSSYSHKQESNLYSVRWTPKMGQLAKVEPCP